MKITHIPRFAPIALLALGFALSSDAQAGLIAGVDFENGSGGFSRSPDDLNASDGITVSSGTSGSVYEGWTLGANGNLRNDSGANSAGAFEGNYPARLQDSGATWSITIPTGVVLDLDEITFAVRGATGGTGRDIQFRTSLEGATEFLYENLNLPGRDIGWTEVTLSLTDTKYDGLTATTVDFIFTSPNGADLDAITVSGTVPEPSTLALAAFGLLGLRRRRQRA